MPLIVPPLVKSLLAGAAPTSEATKVISFANDLEFISLNKEDSKNIQEELVLKFQEEYKKAGENPLNIQFQK